MIHFFHSSYIVTKRHPDVGSVMRMLCRRILEDLFLRQALTH
jgi:hypothetical protein